MTSRIYTSIETAKNGSLIPVLINGKTIDSRYNPDREADSILTQIEKTYSYFIVTGISCGILIDKLNIKFPEALVICIERSTEDINFLTQIPLVSKLKSNHHNHFCTIETLQETILNTYLPAKFGELKIIERRPWLQENSDILPELQKLINKSIGIVSADYSVQSHFGKIWQKNILNNLLNLSKIKNSNIFTLDKSKTAYIIAAGPSFDKTINELKDNDNKFVISTDTAYSSLLKNNIIPDVVVSIDGQFISANHFIKLNLEKTLFLFDLCSNSSAAKHILEANGNLIFFKSGHPLSEIADIYLNHKLYSLYTGSGTVTIAAVDFAIKSGFTKIKVLGADFGYMDGKAYTKGTYFDSLYNIDSDKILTLENKFNKLLFRTELFKDADKITTTLLNTYKSSFEEYLLTQNANFSYENNIYNISVNSDIKCLLSNPENFNFSDFINYISSLNIKDLEIPLLPYIAWLKNNSSEENYEALLKLAHATILSYNS